MIQTNYGLRSKGSSRFVVVAPHAAGDDLRTKEIAEEIARQLNASLVVNNKYIKPSNSNAEAKPHLVEDFNKLSWSSGQQKYLWSKKHPHMKEFYDHVKEFAEHARSYGDGRAIVVYIHGAGDNSEKIGIDIGFGAKYHQGRLKGTQGRSDRHPAAGNNTGVLRANREDIEKLKQTLEERLSDDHNLKVGVGENFAAWSRQDGVQYHAGTSDHSFQLEISSFLRKDANTKYTAKLIADALKAIYEPVEH
ncbi:hypothetical protein JW756_01875 [Candidatus Woesearchaeota archaeon]|nr:hypothetical protein [Candidatus Woesearchaeota archaeon]